MRDRDMDQAALMAALGTMPPYFRTKDLSEHPAMLAAHESYRDDVNYDAMVGKALGRLARRRVLPPLRRAGGLPNDRGAPWERLISDATKPSSVTLPVRLVDSEQANVDPPAPPS